MIIPALKSERLFLKPLSKEHLTEEYVSWLNDPEVYKFLETSGNYEYYMLEEYIKEIIRKQVFMWGIHLSETGSHIGNIKIDPINTRHGLAEYGILMGKKSEWGKGYAKEASIRIINFCFTELNIRKLMLGVVKDNSSAVKLYEKLGFETEGIYKQHGLYDGKYCDVIRMVLFNPNYKNA